MLVLLFAILWGNLLCLSASTTPSNATFALSLIHLNDFHDKYEEMSPSSGVCKSDKCIGGYSRIYYKIKELKTRDPDAIVLNAGDNFQGTFWYMIYKWNVTQHFFNLLPTDVYTLGNHEFDDGVEGLVPYLKALKAPTVVANIDDTGEHQLQGLYNKSTVIKRGDKKIGVIGIISPRTNELSNTGNLRFLDPVGSIEKESKNLINIHKVDTIIILSHCSYETDIKIAKKMGGKIGIIVGGHSHTFLYTGTPLPGPDKPLGPYPTIVTSESGSKVLVVQASANSKYLGNLKVHFNEKGEVLSWEGAPIYLNSSIPQDEDINKEISVWKKAVDAEGDKIVGFSRVLLQQDHCRMKECNLGNLVTDAMVFSHLDTKEKDAWAFTSIAIINSGSFRTSIPKGNITVGDVSIAIPFQNTVNVGEMKGKHLKKLFEDAVGAINNTSNFKINLLQVSGLRIVYNITKPKGERVEYISVLCRKCLIPQYKKLDLNETYRMAISSFLNNGGDGHLVFREHFKLLRVGKVDSDAVKEFVRKKSPIIHGIQDRITIVR